MKLSTIQVDRPVQGSTVGPMEIVKAQEHRTQTNGQPQDELTKRFKQPDASLVRLRQHRGRQIGI